MNRERSHPRVPRSALAAVVSALIGVVCLHLYLRSYEAEVRGGEMIPVLSLTRDVTPGTLLGPGLLEVRRIPERYLDERHVPAADLERVQGTPAQVALVAGDALRWTDLGISEGAEQLSRLVPVGRRAVLLDGSQVSFGGLLRPGDRVDVLLTQSAPLGGRAEPRTRTLLENVMVLAVGSEMSIDGAAGARRGSAVTLSVFPEEARLFESQRRQGDFSLALRNPDDVTLARTTGGDDGR